MKVLVTGGNGFIGAPLCRGLAARGWDVVAGMRVPTGPAAVAFDLARPTVDADYDAVVHLAFDVARPGAPENATGPVALLRALPHARHVYVSSYSAHAHATSAYGRTKYAVERAFLDAGQRVVRPGLVLGAGGVFGRLASVVRRLPVLPLIDGGRALVPIVGLDLLVRCLGDVVAGVDGVEHNLFHDRRMTLRALCGALATHLGRRPLPVAVPHPVALAGARWLGRVVRLPITEDNIRGLVANEDAPHASTLARLVPDADPDRDLRDTLERYF